MSICNILVLITVAIQVAECIYDQGFLHLWTPCVTPQTGSLCREIPAAASPPHHHCHHLHSRVYSPAPHRRRKLLGKQPQVQPGARRGTDNKATTVEEHQASGRLSTPAADSGGGVSASRHRYRCQSSRREAGRLFMRLPRWKGRKTDLTPSQAIRKPPLMGPGWN